MMVRLILAVNTLGIYPPVKDLRLGEISVRTCYLILRTKLAAIKGKFYQCVAISVILW